MIQPPNNPNFKDITGQVFGRLTVMGLVKVTKSYKTVWRCRCSCGKEVERRGDAIRAGCPKSCGCLKQEMITTHGLSYHPDYPVWINMIRRCYAPVLPSYRNYGGRGITVCDQWRRSPAQFFKDMGPRPSNAHEIDRKDNNRGYEPNNCRWANLVTQARNKRSSIKVSFSGRTLTLPEWVEVTGIKWGTLYKRIVIKKWPLEKALTVPAVIGGTPARFFRLENTSQNLNQALT